MNFEIAATTQPSKLTELTVFSQLKVDSSHLNQIRQAQRCSSCANSLHVESAHAFVQLNELHQTVWFTTLSNKQALLLSMASPLQNLPQLILLSHASHSFAKQTIWILASRVQVFIKHIFASFHFVSKKIHLWNTPEASAITSITPHLPTSFYLHNICFITSLSQQYHSISCTLF